MLAVSAGTLAAETSPATPPELAGPVDAGYRDFSFGSATLATPTGEKPQSKLWWNDGVWWGCLWDPAAGAHRIHRFDPVTQTWSSVGPNADNRLDTLVDVLWDGTRLYILSHVFDSSGEFRLHSYTYDTTTDTYSLRSGFPVVMGSGSAEALTIAKDTTGKLWITWEQSGNIMVNRSTSGETTWGAAFRLPVQGNNTASDDISGVIAYSGQVGIMWSNQSDSKMYFALHQDGTADNTWLPREEALANATLGKVADDHLSMAITNTTSPPTLFAVTKTSLSGAATLPQIYLLRRQPTGVWTSYVAGDQDDDHTRAIVQIDDENRKIYIIARSNAGDNAIRMKISDLDNVGFADGPGTAFIQSLANPEINNVSGTKQTLNGTTNLLVIASDEVSRYYFHNMLDLPSVAIPDISVTPIAPAYGDVRIGSSSAQTFVVHNDGNGSLQVTATSLAGLDPSQFVITSGGGSFSVAPGATHDVVVSFAPTSLGAKSATLTFASNDPNENPFAVPLTGTGVAPDIVATPAAHDFGTVTVGDSAMASFTIGNVGTAILNVATSTFQGKDASLFALASGGAPFAVAPGDSHVITVRFVPDHADAMTARLRLTSDDPDETPLSLELDGLAVDPLPDIAVSPIGYDFGPLTLGTSVTDTFTVRNTGTGALHLTDSRIVGPDSTDFAITSGGGTVTVASGDSMALVVQFTPTLVGPRAATLRVESDDPDETAVDVALAGSGLVPPVPDIAVSPMGYDFGSLTLGTSITDTFTVRNTGTGALHLTNSRIVGPDSTDFAITSGGGTVTVASGDSMALVVRFAPTLAGPRSATLRVESDDPDESAVDVAVAGSGLVPSTPDIAVNPIAHDFGDMLAGTSGSHGITVHNSGNTALDIIALQLLGTDAGDFTFPDSDSTFTVAPGDSHVVALVFAPTFPGPRTATLRIASNDPDENPVDVALAGRGVQPDIAVQPLAYGFPTLVAGDSAAHAIVVRNEGSATLHVSAARFTAPDSTDFGLTSALPFTVAPGDSFALGIRFAPLTPGGKSTTLVIESDDADENPVLMALSGAAVVSFTPDLEAPGTALFGLVARGSTDSLALEIGNTGTSTLHVLAPALVGPDSLHFILVTAGAFDLAPSATTSIIVAFHPLATGVRHATLRLESDDPDENPWNIALEGTGGAPDLVVSPDAFAFGNVGVGSTAQHTFDLTNQGTVPLHVSSTSCTGIDSGAFTVTSGGGAFDLAPGSHHDLVVSFLPATAGMKGAALVIASTDPGGPKKNIALSGGGAAAPPGTNPPTYAESASGSASGAFSVSTTDSLAVLGGQLYLVAVSTHPLVGVVSVEGMGLTWSRISAQCGANQTTGIEVWAGHGSPVAGTVTATLDAAPASAVLLVSRYAGVDPLLPVGASAAANTLGISGTCTGGVDSAAYALPFGNTSNGAIVFAAVATGAGNLTPGTNWTLRNTTHSGTDSTACGVALLDRVVPTSGSIDVDGTLDTAVDWALAAVEIRALDPTTDVGAGPQEDAVDRTSLNVRSGSAGQAPSIELALPHAAPVRLTLHDVRGKRLATIWQGVLAAGRHELPWAESDRGLASGLYFVRADLGDQVVARKVLLLH